MTGFDGVDAGAGEEDGSRGWEGVGVGLMTLEGGQ